MKDNYEEKKEEIALAAKPTSDTKWREQGEILKRITAIDGELDVLAHKMGIMHNNDDDGMLEQVTTQNED